MYEFQIMIGVWAIAFMLASNGLVIAFACSAIREAIDRKAKDAIEYIDPD